MNENEAYELINKGMTNFSQLPQSYRPVQNIQQIVPQRIQEVQIEKPIIENEIQPKIVQKAIEPIFQNEPLEKVPKTIEVTELKPKIRRTKTIKKNLFIEKVEDYLKKEGIEISNVIKKGKKEYHALVSVNNPEGNGKNEYLCIAKEKKSISDKELMKNLQVGQRKNLPVLFVTSGEASKKAIEWLDYLGNVIIYKKME